MNKHKTIAIFIAPFLALGGYILADIYSSKDDITKDKKLVVTGQCKPLDDQCEILGIGMEMRLAFKTPPSYQRLLPVTLYSETSLDDVAMSLIINGAEMSPVKMKMDQDKKHWGVNLMPNTAISPNNLKVRLVVSYKAALHFAEFPIVY